MSQLGGGLSEPFARRLELLSCSARSEGHFYLFRIACNNHLAVLFTEVRKHFCREGVS
jgi:hypothetical protein